MNKQEATEIALNHKVYITGQSQFNRYIPFEVVEDIIEKLDTQEVQKVVIPRYVSEWIGYCKANGLTLLGAIDPVSKFGEGLADTFTGELNRCLSWVRFNQNTFASAWLDGYKVEEEKLYTVELPDPNSDYTYRFLSRSNKGLIINGSCDDYWKHYSSNRLTEEEIKKDFDWAWQFATEVK